MTMVSNRSACTLSLSRLLMPLFFSGVVLVVGGGILYAIFPDAELLLKRNWAITPVAVLAAAFANATAIGGGFLFIPLFIFGYGLSASQSLKLSLATQAFGMTSGAIGWSSGFIVGRALLIATVASSIGMYIGTFYLPVNAVQIKAIFGCVMVLTGLGLIVEMKFGERQHGLRIQGDSILRAGVFAVACFFGGLINSWVSLGIGEVVALYLLFVYRIRIDLAVATGVAALALDSIIGFALHFQIGGIPWEYLMFTAPGVVIGGRYGARVGRYLEARSRGHDTRRDGSRSSNYSPLKIVFAAVVILDGVAMLLETYLNP